MPELELEEEQLSASRWTCFGHAAAAVDVAAVGKCDAVAAADIAVVETVAVVVAAADSDVVAAAVAGTAVAVAWPAADTP